MHYFTCFLKLLKNHKKEEKTKSDILLTHLKLQTDWKITKLIKNKLRQKKKDQDLPYKNSHVGEKGLKIVMYDERRNDIQNTNKKFFEMRRWAFEELTVTKTKLIFNSYDRQHHEKKWKKTEKMFYFALKIFPLHVLGSFFFVSGQRQIPSGGRQGKSFLLYLFLSFFKLYFISFD